MDTKKKVASINTFKIFVKNYVKALIFSYGTVTIKRGVLPSDIDTENSPLTEGFDSEKETYQSYFDRNTNPDTASYKFLDELDRVLSLSKKRVIVVESENENINYAKVIGDYLSLQ